MPEQESLTRCEHDGCEGKGLQCLLYDPETGKVAEYWYCSDHIQEEGFCWGCGQFWAGVESFDFSPNGLCSECRYDPDLGYEPEPDVYDEADWLVYADQEEGAP